MIKITIYDLYMLKKWIHAKFDGETVEFFSDYFAENPWIAALNQKRICRMIINYQNGDIHLWISENGQFEPYPNITEMYYYESIPYHVKELPK